MNVSIHEPTLFPRAVDWRELPLWNVRVEDRCEWSATVHGIDESAAKRAASVRLGVAVSRIVVARAGELVSRRVA